MAEPSATAIEPREQASATDWLRAEYLRRKGQNPSYSMRAFARHLKISSGSLSEIFSGKRAITIKQGSKLADRLGLAPEDANRFMEFVRLDIVAKKPSFNQASQKRFHTIDLDRFHLIADWYHFALLSLMETRDFRPDPTWMAQRLGIRVVEVRMALDRLCRLGYLSRTPEGAVELRSPPLTTDDVPSAALRKSHAQSLNQAIEALSTVDPKNRDITSMTIAVNKERLAVAKEIIRIFGAI